LRHGRPTPLPRPLTIIIPSHTNKHTHTHTHINPFPQSPAARIQRNIAKHAEDITQLLRKNGKANSKAFEPELPENVFEVLLDDASTAYWPTNRVKELPARLTDPALADPAQIKRLLRKNVAMGAKRYFPDLPAAHYEVLLHDGTTSYWPTKRAKELDKRLITDFAKQGVSDRSTVFNPVNNPVNNAARTTVRDAARSANPKALQDALVAIYALIEQDEAMFPCNLLQNVNDDVPNRSCLNGDIEAKCALKFLKKTNHDAMSRSPCSVCFESAYNTSMENVDCTPMPHELFAPLKYGTWNRKAVFEFSPTFAELNGK
jgi:hypothetical protein